MNASSFGKKWGKVSENPIPLLFHAHACLFSEHRSTSSCQASLLLIPFDHTPSASHLSVSISFAFHNTKAKLSGRLIILCTYVQYKRITSAQIRREWTDPFSFHCFYLRSVNQIAAHHCCKRGMSVTTLTKQRQQGNMYFIVPSAQPLFQYFC